MKMTPVFSVLHTGRGGFAKSSGDKARESAGVRRTFYVRRNDEERNATQYAGFFRSRPI